MVRALQCRAGSCVTVLYSLVARDINSAGVGKNIDLCCHPEMKCHVEQLRIAIPIHYLFCAAAF